MYFVEGAMCRASPHNNLLANITFPRTSNNDVKQSRHIGCGSGPVSWGRQVGLEGEGGALIGHIPPLRRKVIHQLCQWQRPHAHRSTAQVGNQSATQTAIFKRVFAIFASCMS